MTCDTVPPRNWGLMEGGALLRSGRSLAGLAASGACDRKHPFSVLLERLAALSPLDERPDHALQHLHTCACDARRLMEDPRFGLSPEAVNCLMLTFELALIAAMDGLVFLMDDSKFGPVSQEDHSAVAAIALRHGAVIQQWWQSYSAAIEALFGGGRP